MQNDFVVDDRGEIVNNFPGIVLNIFLVFTIEIDVFFASTSLIFEFVDKINLGALLFSLVRGLDDIEDVTDVITNRFYFSVLKLHEYSTVILECIHMDECVCQYIYT